MHIDWNALSDGVGSELAKSANLEAATPPATGRAAWQQGARNVVEGAIQHPLVRPLAQHPFTAAPRAVFNNVTKPALDFVSGGAMTGLQDKYNAAGKAISAVGDVAGQVLPIGLAAGGAALLGGLGGGKGRSTPEQPSTGGYAPGRRTLLTRGHGDVNSLVNPMTSWAPQGGGLKLAGVMDSVGWAARNRVANMALNAATGLPLNTNPLHAAAEPPAKRNEDLAKEVELVTKYPEIKAMLEQPETKEHLLDILEGKA